MSDQRATRKNPSRSTYRTAWGCAVNFPYISLVCRTSRNSATPLLRVVLESGQPTGELGLRATPVGVWPRSLACERTWDIPQLGEVKVDR